MKNIRSYDGMYQDYGFKCIVNGWTIPEVKNQIVDKAVYNRDTTAILKIYLIITKSSDENVVEYLRRVAEYNMNSGENPVWQIFKDVVISESDTSDIQEDDLTASGNNVYVADSLGNVVDVNIDNIDMYVYD